MEPTDLPVRPGTLLAVLLLSVLLAVAAAILILAGAPVPAGILVAVAAVPVAVAGPVALRAGRPRLRFAASVMDRVVDAAILGALAWALLPGAPGAALAAVAALSAAFLAAYLRVKGAGLGFEMAAWPAAQPLRMAAVAVALLTPIRDPALWGAAAVGVAEAVLRSVRLAAQGDRT